MKSGASLNSRDVYLIQVAIKRMREECSSDRRKLELTDLLEKLDAVDVENI
ncbi:hypothetical protein M5X04_26980 [Paenibacillus alvei]|uniref:Uncharacterized protein n=1 Tax=Paenibacillus alvei TaxID=44250 RepID=A0ABT4EJZ2_PAEAL|nr:hypothetical protein [Paenibacillus alvei]MCY9532958.1 hypothetical protein [Paenibacillus alvei]